MGGASAIHRIHKDIEKGIERTLTGWVSIVILHVGGFVLFVFIIVFLSDFMDKKQNKTDT